MKARSKKILGSAVVAAASVACALPAAKAAVPILYEVSATSSTTVAASGGTVNFDVLALVTGTNASAADDGFVSGQFSLIQAPGTGVTGGALSFTLSSNYAPSASHNTNTAVFGSVPAANASGNLGTGVNSTGSANDTIVGFTGVSNSGPSTAVPVADGTTSVGGTAYNLFHVGSGTLTLPAEPAGASATAITLVPRGGLGSVIKPQVAFIDGTVQAFRGDDPNVGVIGGAGGLGITIAGGGPSFVHGDLNGDGVFDFGDIDNFFGALNEGDPFSQFIADNDAAFFATYGQHLSEAAVTSLGDFNSDGVFDFGDIDPFFTSLAGGASLGA